MHTHHPVLLLSASVSSTPRCTRYAVTSLNPLCISHLFPDTPHHSFFKEQIIHSTIYHQSFSLSCTCHPSSYASLHHTVLLYLVLLRTVPHPLPRESLYHLVLHTPTTHFPMDHVISQWPMFCHYNYCITQSSLYPSSIPLYAVTSLTPNITTSFSLPHIYHQLSYTS